MCAANQEMPRGRIKRRVKNNGFHTVRKQHLRFYAQIENPILIAAALAETDAHPRQSRIKSNDDFSDRFGKMQTLLGRCQHKSMESRRAKTQKAGLKLFEFLFNAAGPLLGIQQRFDIPADILPHAVDLFARRQRLIDRHIRVVIHKPIENRFKGYPAAYGHILVRRLRNEFDRHDIKQSNDIIIDKQAFLTLARKQAAPGFHPVGFPSKLHRIADIA
ncbi:hypothetical protein SAMN05443582_11639 [Phyllobacterium sp. OV277]|nr:hypothetical protein SAMN05443582_11639 [Phyllobacterium sp. OV277]